MGDATNLLGCLLTNQLPFQRNLAIYFTFVDIILLYQYRRFSRHLPTDYQPLRRRSRSISRTRSYSAEPESPEDRWQRHLSQVSAAELETASGQAREYSRSMSRLGRKRQTSAQTTGGGVTDDTCFSPTGSEHSPALVTGTELRSPIHEQRGRSLARSNPQIKPPTPSLTSPAPSHSTLRSASHANLFTSPSSRLPTSLVFLGLFTFLVFRSSPDFRVTEAVGQAWSSTPLHSRALAMSKSEDWQQVVGRASSWTCALLYLTSRLPQIWKNYNRKSVEGLSMLLFVMAFVGNATYVMSVMSAAEVNLSESIPYLLGSGGTLCFDFTIFVQSRLYRPGRRGLDVEQQQQQIPRSRSHTLFHDPTGVVPQSLIRNSTQTGAHDEHLHTLAESPE